MTTDPRFKGPGGKNDKDRLYIMCYDHTDWHCGRFDTSYICSRHFYKDHVLPLMKYPRLKIGNQFGGGYYDHLAGLTHPTELEHLVEQKKLITDYHCDIVGGTYSQAISAFLPEETAIRQFTYGLESIKKHMGVPVDYYAFSENTGWYYLPQILNDFGFKGALLRSHYQPMGYPPECVASLVNWTGPDGSKIAAIPAYDDNLRVAQHGMSGSEAALLDWHQYVEEIERAPTILDGLNRYFDESKEKGVDYVVVASVEDSSWHIVFDQLFPMLEEIDPNGEKYRFVTLKEAVSMIQSSGYEAQDFDPVPNQWSFMHNAGYVGGLLTRWNSIAAARIGAAEALCAFANLTHGAQIDHHDGIAHAYRQHLNAEAHDGYEVPETTWTAVQQLLDADRTIRPLTEIAVNALCGGIDASRDMAVVFNTLNYPRMEPVELWVPAEAGFAIGSVADPQGNDVPFDVLETNAQSVKLAFTANVPAFGHSAYRLTRKPGKDAVTLMKAAAVDGIYGGVTITGGKVQGLRSPQGKELFRRVDVSGNFYNLEHIDIQHFYKEQGVVLSVLEGKTRTVIQTGGLLGSEQFGIDYTVYEDFSYTGIEAYFVCKSKIGIGTPIADPNEAWGEANHNCRQNRLNLNLKPAFSVCDDGERRWEEDYPFRSHEAYNREVHLTRYTPFYPEEYKRENDFNTFRSTPHVPDLHVYDVNSRYWADLSEKSGEYGAIVCGAGNLTMTYDGCEWSFVQLQASKFMPSCFGFVTESREYENNSSPEAYRWRYRVIPHGECVSKTTYSSAGEPIDAHRAGVSFNNPLVASYCPVSGGTLPLAYSYLSGFEESGLISTAVMTDDTGFYIRLYEYAGQSHTLPLSDLMPVSMDFSKELPEEPIGIGPYKIKTYKVN